MNNTEKNLKIKETFAATKQRRKSMLCRVFTTKIQYNKLNRLQKEQLAGKFREAKWIYNSILSQSKEGMDIFTLTEKDFLSVNHLDKDGNVLTDEVKCLSKREVQTVISSVKANISNLSKAKKKGLKVGSLRYISSYSSINLPQYGVNYRIENNNRVKVGKIHGTLKVNGLDQMKNLDCEFANARLICRSSGYYIAFTVYTEKAEREGKKAVIGLDMGCETSITMSNGEKVNCQIGETERLKRLQRSLARCKKGSNNRRKIRSRIRREYEHVSNMKDDAANKLVHRLSKYKVVIQDEQLAKWGSTGHGKKVHGSFLGRVKSRLMGKCDTYVISKWVPTTKLCTECGCKVDLKLSDRIFVCPVCGHTEDRDVHAAKNMLWFYSKRETLLTGHKEYDRVSFRQGLSSLFGASEHDAAESLSQW